MISWFPVFDLLPIGRRRYLFLLLVGVQHPGLVRRINKSDPPFCGEPGLCRRPRMDVVILPSKKRRWRRFGQWVENPEKGEISDPLEAEQNRKDELRAQRTPFPVLACNEVFLARPMVW